MKKDLKILLGLIFLLIIINYPFLDSALTGFIGEGNFDEFETGIVSRVIDGDTVEINNESVRLLGINSPERGEEGYFEAKEFMEEKALNEEVKIYFEKRKYDKYYRKLGYIYFNGENLNLESVREGYSNFYFPDGKTRRYNSFKEAWEECLSLEKNLCEKSVYWGCINTKILGENLIIKNICSDLDLYKWSVKDEGRKNFVFGSGEKIGLGEEIMLTPEDFGENYVWTKTGDSIFIRDDENKLVYWESW